MNSGYCKEDDDISEYSFYSKNIMLTTSWRRAIKSLRNRVLSFEDIFINKPSFHLQSFAGKDFKDFDSTKMYIDKFVKKIFSYFNFRKLDLSEGEVLIIEGEGFPAIQVLKKVDLELVRLPLDSKPISVNLKGAFISHKNEKKIIPFQISGKIEGLSPDFNLFCSTLDLKIEFSDVTFCHLAYLFRNKFTIPDTIKGSFDITIHFQGRHGKEGSVSGKAEIKKVSFGKPDIFPLWPAHKRMHLNYLLTYDGNGKKLSIEKLYLKAGTVNISLKGDILETCTPSPICDLTSTLSATDFEELKKVFPFGLIPTLYKEFFLNRIKGGKCFEAVLKFKGKFKGISKSEFLRGLEVSTKIKDLEVTFPNKRFPQIRICNGGIKYKEGELYFFSNESKVLNSFFNIERGRIIKRLQDPLLDMVVTGKVLPEDIVTICNAFNARESIFTCLNKVNFSNNKLPLRFQYTGVLRKIFNNFKLAIDLNGLDFFYQNFPPVKGLKGMISIDGDTIAMDNITGHCCSEKIIFKGNIINYRSKKFYYTANIKGDKLKLIELAPYFIENRAMNIGGMFGLNISLSGRGNTKENINLDGKFSLKGGRIDSSTKEKAFLPIEKLNMDVKISPSLYDYYGTGYLGNSLTEFKGSYKCKSSKASLILTSPDFDLNQIRPEKKSKKRNYIAGKAFFIKEMTGKYISLIRKYKFLQKLTLLFNFQAKEATYRDKNVSDINLWIELLPDKIFLHEVSYSVHEGFFKEKGNAFFEKDKLKKFSYEYNVKDLTIEDIYKRDKGASPLISAGKLSMIGTLNGNINVNNIREYLNGKLALDIQDGRYNRIKYIGKILQVINFSKWGEKIINTSTPGIPFSDFTMDLLIKEGVASTSNLTLNSNILRFLGVGKMDMTEEILDLILAVQPFVAIDTMVSMLPLIGEVFTGDNKRLFVTYFEIKGKTSDLQVNPIPIDYIKNLGEGILGIFNRLLRLPAKIISKPLP
ncbi:MAG: AsmA-like C-terminal domain-containing protein [Thermodesulfobacteriota bacterium]|nr:AsmA-like C-terminal domain-containing protein [Thermodesulfobacteriota bacterium]